MGAGALDRRTEEHLVPRARGSTEFEPMIAGDVVGDLRWHRHSELALRGARRIDATVDMDVLLRHGKFLHPGRSEERRVGTEWVSTCRARGSLYHEEKNTRQTRYKRP